MSCVSEYRLSVSAHRGVMHATSGLEVFLMDPGFLCDGSTIPGLKAPVTSSWLTGVG